VGTVVDHQRAEMIHEHGKRCSAKNPAV
jgi:hypothetical protein